jgi:predicted transglutaminase-like cysteine proteinase
MIIVPFLFGILLGSSPSFADGSKAPFYFENPSLAPQNAVAFCLKNRADCEVHPASVQHNQLSAKDQLQQLKEINELAAKAIKEDIDKRGDAGVDPWLLFPQTGNCSDLSVSKRHKLLELGWNSDSLLLAIVKTPLGGGHTILIVRTPEGDLVLDSLTNKILPVSKVKYNWLAIQSPKNPNYWFKATRTQALNPQISPSDASFSPPNNMGMPKIETAPEVESAPAVLSP